PTSAAIARGSTMAAATRGTTAATPSRTTTSIATPTTATIATMATVSSTAAPTGRDSRRATTSRTTASAATIATATGAADGARGRRAPSPHLLLAPGRDDLVHARVGDQLPEMLVQIAVDRERRLRRRHVATHHLALAGHRGRIE